MINPTIETLLVLQDRDVKVASLTSELETLPDQIEDVAEQLEIRKGRFEEIKNRTRLIETERKKLDLEVQSKQTAIARYRTQQQTTRKNEEFSALSHEIEHAEKEISALEDRELELMEAYDAGLATVAQGQKELAAFEEKTKQKTADLQKRIAAAAGELSGAKERQAAVEKTVPEDVLARYRRILKSKRDVAIVPIHAPATCSGCHMKLTSQTVVTARSADHLATCENCGRLVYWLE